VLLFILISMMVLSGGAWVYVSKREHLLSVLLSLEYMRLRIFMLLILIFEGSDLFYGMIYITFTACEGALGLSVLVIMRRTHGGDFFKTFNLF